MMMTRCPEAYRVFCNPVKVMGIFVASLVGFLVWFSAMSGWPSYGFQWSQKPGKEDVNLDDIIEQIRYIGDSFPQPVEVPKDKLLGGLFPEGLDVNTCVSRYQSALYRKEQKHQPSPNLVSRLRKYEALHKQCGPFTESYNRTLEYLKSGNHGQDSNSTGCKYVIWIPMAGLGNRMLSLSSAFLYALLTNRVLLVDPGSGVSDLFCEPFPEVSWLLPSNFPLIGKFSSVDQKSPETFGNLLRNRSHANSTSSSLPPYLYLYLVHDYDDFDKRIFCDHDHTILQNIPWLIVKSNIYFAPSLVSIPSFQQDISDLFPNLGTVFHYLGRYLFNPTNFIWGLVTRYYNINLARADEKIGIQIRVLDKDFGRFERVLNQTLGCMLRENLLPEINGTKPVVIQSGKLKTKALLITSLRSWYSEAIKSMYWKRSTVTGEVVEVHQPSHEQYQHTRRRMHNIKAWAEIYLLSLTDKLVTSGGSTFGYIAHSLGGLKPWILYKPEDHVIPNPPCQRGVSMEPCMHAPPYYDCTSKKWTGPGGKLDPNVQHCDDKWWGIKFIDRE
nr:galactoside 2-alpha-L-fucosyltransferase-like [Coffea arabica]